MNNNEINPSLKEKIYQETLDEIAQAFSSYNPEGDNATIFNWHEFIQEGNLYACGDQGRIEKAVKQAIDKAKAEQAHKDRENWDKDIQIIIKDTQHAERQRCIEKLYDIDGETEAESLWFMEHVLERIRKREDARAKFGGSKELPPRDMIWEGINYYKEQAIAKLSKKSGEKI